MSAEMFLKQISIWISSLYKEDSTLTKVGEHHQIDGCQWTEEVGKRRNLSFICMWDVDLPLDIRAPAIQVFGLRPSLRPSLLLSQPWTPNLCFWNEIPQWFTCFLGLWIGTELYHQLSWFSSLYTTVFITSSLPKSHEPILLINCLLSICIYI